MEKKQSSLILLCILLLVCLTWFHIYNELHMTRSFKPYYTYTEVMQDDRRKKITLFVAMMSATGSPKRRTALRNTWLSHCKQHNESVCLFMMDTLDTFGKPIPAKRKSILINEAAEFNDIVMLDTFEGYNFAYRLFRSILWAAGHYNFDFFLRIDDDYYLCFDRLMQELPHRKKEKYIYWGFEHCFFKNTRIDDGFTIYGSDLIRLIVENKDRLMCNMFADQVVPEWFENVTNQLTWYSDPRVMHERDNRIKVATASELNICTKYLAIHQAYPDLMIKFHDIYKENQKQNVLQYSIPKPFDACAHGHANYTALYEKKLCISKPLWVIGEKYRGREED